MYEGEKAFLEIGAGLGYFVFGAAIEGFKVYAFEPLMENLYAMRMNLCKM